MRSLLAVVALAGLLVPLPSVLAQDGAALVLEDKSADVQTLVAGTPAGNPTGRFASNDLVSLAVEEAKEGFTFHLKVASLTTSPEVPGAESTVYAITFSHGTVSYRVLFWRMVAQQADYGGRLQVYDAGRNAYASSQDLPVVVDAPDGIMSATVARDQLLDENGAAPFPGRLLTGFFATATGLRMGDGNLCLQVVPCQQAPQTAVVDRMPDTGVGAVDLPVRLGLAQTGYAYLYAETPVRASNGEATTFVFQVNATNRDDGKHLFSLVANGVPGAWQVNVPSSVIEIGAGQTVTLPVLVTTPFGHNHGTFQDFILSMTSIDDGASVGRVQLGIRYTATPQPAGHHSELFLHTSPSDGDQTFTDVFGTAFGFDAHQLYFNTVEDDDNDAHTPVGGTSRFEGTSPTGRYIWTVPLSPPLAMGLDFDLSLVGNLRVSLDSVLPLPGAVLSGRVIHLIPEEPCDPRRDQSCEMDEDDYFIGRGVRTEAALIGPSQVVEVGAMATNVLFEAPITPLPAGDYLPFLPGATLTLQLELTFQRPDTPFGPRDMPKISGGSMILPLAEYHDAVDTVFASSAGLMIEVDGDQQRQVNAGETAVFDLRLMNHDDRAHDYALQLSGPNALWADILGDARITIAPGESRPLAIAVAAPDTAIQGDLADLVLTAANAADPSQRTLARLVVLVDENADHPDDASRVAALDGQLSEKQSPGPALGLAIAALAALAIARRRRAT